MNPRVLVLFFVASLTLFIGSGCGPSDPCAETTCSLGTCESESGECVNASSCAVDADCVAGYICGPGGECVGETECSDDGDCSAGVCNDEGICVNDGSGCDSDTDCVPRTYCNAQSQCAPDPCNNIRCPRGVCERGTDNCVSRESCSESTEEWDCVAGEKCAEGTCAPASSFCDNLTCDRGVCSFEAGGCTNPADCQQEGAECLQGYFCDSMGTCRPDLCVQNQIECDRGTCRPANGQCQNAESCQRSSDCVANHVCVEGTCRLKSLACGNASGDRGCPGNRTCSYDPDSGEATCLEPAICTTSFDCRSGRQCGGRSCVGWRTCRPDDLEPNDTAGQATDIRQVSGGDARLSGTLCQGDVDRFRVDTNDFVSDATSGVLLVDLAVPRRDAGLGSAEVVILKDGTEVRTAQTGALGRDPTIQAEVPLGTSDHGTYAVEVRAGEDMRAAGVTYEIAVAVVSQDVQTACQQAVSLRANQSITGTTEGAPSSSLASQCGTPDNTKNERIYRLELDSPQQMTFDLNPQSEDSRMTMSIRSQCAQPSSETHCAGRGGRKTSETLTALLGAGTHFLIVQPLNWSQGGAFELETSTVYRACAPGDGFCDGEDRAHICRSDGGRFDAVACDAGCNPSTGTCYPPAGDICNDAESISSSDIPGDEPITRTLQFKQLNDDYRVDGTSCPGMEGSRSDGPDKAFEVNLPSMQGMRADVTFEDGVQGSLYVVEDCSQTQQTCQRGALDSTENASSESITFSNRTDQPITRYLLVDTAGGQNVGTAELSLSYEAVSCSPGAATCTSGEVEACNPAGTRFEIVDRCGFSCEQATCQGETCSNAITVPDDGQSHSYTLDMDDFANDYDIAGAQCMDDNVPSRGPDAVFELQADASDVVTLDWDTNREPRVYVTTDCTNLSTSCVNGVSAFSQGSVDTTFVASQDDTYYVVADLAETGSSPAGSATLTAQVQAPTCTPYSGSCSGSGDFNFCNRFGLEDTYGCSNCCQTIGSASSSPGTTIPASDSTGITDTVTVSGCSGTTSKLYVGMGITHITQQDLTIDVTGPAGNTVTLHDEEFMQEDDIKGVYPETLNSTQALSTFHGSDPNGTWTLKVVDDGFVGYEGTLDDWGVYATCD